MLRLTICLVVVMTYIYVLCLFGNEVTANLEQVNRSISESSWNVYPLKMQKYLIVMLIISEEPVYIQGFMNTKCTREVLKKVMISWNINNKLLFQITKMYKI